MKKFYRKIEIIETKTDTIEASLDTDIRNNIDIEKELSRFLLNTLELDTDNKAEWALIRYFENKKTDTVKVYRDIKDDITLLSSTNFHNNFLGNGRAELEEKYNYFPEDFLNKINLINQKTVEEFEKKLLLSDIPFEVKKGKFFDLKISVIKSFKKDIKGILKVYKKHQHLIPRNVDVFTEKAGGLIFHNTISFNKKAIIADLHDFQLTIKNLEAWESYVPEKIKNEYITLKAAIKQHIDEKYRLSNEASSVQTEKIRERIIHFINKIDEKSSSK